MAGAGKTTALADVREAAEHAGYRVEGFAPTSRAAQTLGRRRHPGAARCSTILRVATRRTTDRIALCARRVESGQHAPDARLPPAPAGRRPRVARGRRAATSGRGRRPTLSAASRGRHGDRAPRHHRAPARPGAESGRRATRARRHWRGHRPARMPRDACTRSPTLEERLQAIAREYLRHPEGTLIVSPDNRSRVEINEVIHRARQATGEVAQSSIARGCWFRGRTSRAPIGNGRRATTRRRRAVHQGQPRAWTWHRRLRARGPRRRREESRDRPSHAWRAGHV